MMKQLPYEIQLDYTDSKKFYLCAIHIGIKPASLKASLIDWRPLFFCWHQDSYFGTTFPSDNEGVFLTPLEALEFLSKENYRSSLFSFPISTRIQWLQNWAPILLEKMREHAFAPDYEEWKKGKISWKFLNNCDQETLAIQMEQSWKKMARGKSKEELDFFSADFNKKWISEAIFEYVDKKEELSTRWKTILEKYPLLPKKNSYSKYRHTLGFLSEEMWLERIGWKEDPTPFTIEWRLTEPQQEEPLLSNNKKKISRSMDDITSKHSTILAKYNTQETEKGTRKKDANYWTLDVLLRDKTNKKHYIVWNQQSQKAIFNQQYTNDENHNLHHRISEPLPKEWYAFFDKVEERIEQCRQMIPWLQAPTEETGLLHHLTEQEAWTFLTEASIELTEAGFDVLLPAWWEEIRSIHPKLKIELKSSVGSSKQSLLGLQAISDFNWKLATGDAQLEEEEFMNLVEQNRRFIKVNGQWIKLDPAFMKQVKKMMERAKKEGLSLQDLIIQEWSSKPSHENDKTDNIEPALSTIQVELNSHLKKLFFQLHHITSIPSVQTPTTFHGTLRPYQKQGMDWLLFLRKHKLGACLADDMGLGKTVQMITYLLYIKENENPKYPSLIICPTSVLGNWQKEIEKFAPSLKVQLHYGSARKKGEELIQSVQDYDIVLTSYGLSAIDQEDLKKIKWSTICLDEAQNIKNAFTKQSKAIRSFTGDHHIALTGTPIENRLTELWSIFDFINKGYLGSLHSFTKQFVIPIEKEKKEERAIRQIQQLIRPFLLRRSKKDENVNLHLPNKQEQKEYVPLTIEQASLYEQVVQDTIKNIEQQTGIQRRGFVLSMLTKLKQICNHPALYLKDFTEDITSMMERSQKMKKLLELLEVILEQGESCLIFTQYIGMGTFIQQMIQTQLNETAYFLQGRLRKQERDAMIDSFQSGNQKLLILSLKAGGTGLNLTAANHVIHYDRWWNPAVENQATDRAYRIGQNRFVHVHKFITTGTLEEKIDEMLEKKKALSDEIISSENWITELSTDELKELVSLRKGLQ